MLHVVKLVQSIVAEEVGRMAACHGCAGKGWVETSDKKAQTCPICNGSGQVKDSNVGKGGGAQPGEEFHKAIRAMANCSQRLLDAFFAVKGMNVRGIS